MMIVFFLLAIVSLSVLLMVMSGFSFTLDVQMFLQMSFANVFNLSHFDTPSSDHFSSSLVFRLSSTVSHFLGPIASLSL